MKTLEEIVREYCINEVAQQIYQEDFPAGEVRKINARSGWLISGEYRSFDGTFKDIFIPQYRLSNNSLEEAISRSKEMKAQGF